MSATTVTEEEVAGQIDDASACRAHDCPLSARWQITLVWTCDCGTHLRSTVLCDVHTEQCRDLCNHGFMHNDGMVSYALFEARGI